MIFGLAVLSSQPVRAGNSHKKTKKQEAYGLIAGTVFREPGLALPGARIILTPDPETKPQVKVKKMTAASDGRGEFAFRVPPVPMRYSISVEAQGYQGEKKSVSVQAEERQDVYFNLKPVSR